MPPLQFDIISLFPDMLHSFFEHSILKRAQQQQQIIIRNHQLRDWTEDKHQTTDDSIYGGGAGMLLKPEAIFRAVESLQTANSKVILLTPQAPVLTQPTAFQLAQEEHLILLCGHYEGVDFRVIEQLVDAEISIGDYILTNGVIAASVLVDTVARLVPGVLGNQASYEQESFSNDHKNKKLLEAPAYTKPAKFRNFTVPEILLSGNHERIAEWRQQQAYQRTQQQRPDLLS